MLWKTSLCMVIFQMLIFFRWSQTEKETAKILNNAFSKRLNRKQTFMFNPNAKICQQNTFNSTISHHWAHSVKSLAMARLSRLGGGLLVSSPAMALAIKPSWSYLIIILITSIRPCIAQQWIGKSPWIQVNASIETM